MTNATQSGAKKSGAARSDKPWSRHTPEGPWDDIVVGSGMGGMTNAAMLAHLGRRVLVLEQHYVPGGFTHAFPRKGYTWDVGVHVVGDVTSHTLTGRLLELLTDGRLKWNHLGEVYEQFHFPDGFRIDFPDNPRQFRDNLTDAFPDQEEAIDNYFSLVREAAHTMRYHYMSRAMPGWLSPPVRILGRKAKDFLGRTATEVLEELTPDPKLRAVLCAQWGYYGTPPSRAPFAIQALIARHYLHGGYYPVGGAQQIARQLLQTVADNGGWTRILADVQEIVIEKGRAVGVRLADGEEIRARRVTSAIGVNATAAMLPEDCRKPGGWSDQTKPLRPGPAHVCLYMGFKGDAPGAGASPANKWFYDSWDSEAGVWQIRGDQDMSRAPVLYCSFPSMKDPEHDPGPEMKHTGEIVTFVPWESFSEWQDKPWKKRGGDYDAFKQRIQDQLLSQFREHLPELTDQVDYAELGTPLSTDYFCRPQQGSIYGPEGTRERFVNKWMRPRSPIRGLFFSGNEVAVMGVMGAMLGGMMGAIAAEPRATLSMLRPLL